MCVLRLNRKPLHTSFTQRSMYGLLHRLCESECDETGRLDIFERILAFVPVGDVAPISATIRVRGTLLRCLNTLLRDVPSISSEATKRDIFKRVLAFIHPDRVTTTSTLIGMRGRLRRLNRLLRDFPPMSSEVTKRVVIFPCSDEEQGDLDGVVDSKTYRLRFDQFPRTSSVLFVKRLARKSYSFLRAKSSSWFETQFGDFLERFPNGKVVFDAYRLLFEANDSYLAFGLCVTILERALFEIHYEAMEGKKVSGVALLKDLLQSNTSFGDILPHQVVEFFRTLFLPKQGLNLRNLYWHGFMTPGIVSCHNYAALLIHVLASLRPLTKLQRISMWLSSTHCKKQNQCLENFVLKPLSLETLKSLFISSDFVSHEVWFLNAFSMLQNKSPHIKHTSREGLFLVAILPMLEQSLRKVFVASNSSILSVRVAIACKSKYFSTLDGYGQKHLHPVMLTSSLHGKRNKFWDEVGPNTVALLLDLFQIPSGFQLRSKFAHGIADLVTSPSEVSKSTSLLIALIVSLCSRYSSSSPSSSLEMSCNKIVHSYCSRFHTLIYLDELRLSSFETIRELRSLEKCRNWHFESGEIDGEGWLCANDDHGTRDVRILKDRIDRLKSGTQEKGKSLSSISRHVADCLIKLSKMTKFVPFADPVTGIRFDQINFDEKRWHLHVAIFQEIQKIVLNLSARLKRLESCFLFFSAFATTTTTSPSSIQSMKRSQLRTRDRRLYSDTTIVLSTILSICEFAYRSCDLDMRRYRDGKPRYFREIQRLSRELISFSSCCCEDSNNTTLMKKGYARSLLQMLTFLNSSKAGKKLLSCCDEDL